MKKICFLGTLLCASLSLFAQRPWQYGFAISQYQKAPNFTVEMTDGSTFELEKNRGRVVFLDFGSVNCAPCIKAQKTFQEKLFDKYDAEDLAVVPVIGSSCKSWDELKAFCERHGFDFPFGWDKEHKIQGYMKETGVPKWFVINRFGIVTALGTDESFDKAIAEAVAQREEVKTRVLRGGIHMVEPEVGKRLVSLRGQILDAVIDMKDAKAQEHIDVLASAKNNRHKVEMTIEEGTLRVLDVKELDEPDMGLRMGAAASQGSFSVNNGETGEGVRFQNLTFEEALRQAKAENKMVFLDFYTSWCGPCKMMNKTVFPLKSVGDYFNKRFVSMRMDAEKEGKALAQRFEVNAYPTYFVINTDGSVYHKMIGGRTEVDLLADLERVLNDRTKTLPYMDSVYNSGNMPRGMYRDYIHAIAYIDQAKAKQLINELRGKIGEDEKLHPDNWAVVENGAMGSDDYRFVVENQQAWRESVGDEKVDFFFYYNFNVPLARMLTFMRSEAMLKNALPQIEMYLQELDKVEFKEKSHMADAFAFLACGAKGDGEQVSAWIHKFVDGDNAEGIYAMLCAAPAIATQEDLRYILDNKDKIMKNLPLESSRSYWEQQLAACEAALQK